ncbi:hypothetical protein [Amycolatopsis sp. NPDC059657]|uniref:hypothetical protein n=1 Tax=Amycolatopsis sp. NPDC059657 TaxID=3346899 RepID=UPI0036730D9D
MPEADNSRRSAVWPVAGRGRIGRNEVRKVENETKTFRALDYRYGGGWCSEAVAAQLSWGYRMLAADCSDSVRERLCVALADLTSVAGWTSFDAGQSDAAHARFDRALDLARAGGDEVLASNILYRKGRVFLHHDAALDALEMFRLGERAAEDGGSMLMLSVLCANEAWAYAKLGDRDLALASLGRASDAFERSDGAVAPVWARFFGETDLTAMAGTVHTELAVTLDSSYASAAITELTKVVKSYGCSMARSKSFCLVMLATSHLLEGDVDQAAAVADDALAKALTLKSSRFMDRLTPLKKAADCRSDNPDVRALAERIKAFRSVAA